MARAPKGEKRFTPGEKKKEEEEEAEQSYFEAMESIIELVLEIISAFDIFTDAYVVMILVRAKKVFLPSLSIIFMVMALYVCYAPLLHMLLERKTFTGLARDKKIDQVVESVEGVKKSLWSKKKLACWKTSICFFFLTPLMVLYLVILDIMFVLFTFFALVCLLVE